MPWYVPCCPKGTKMRWLQYEWRPVTVLGWSSWVRWGPAVFSEVTVLPICEGTVHICVTEAGLLECRSSEKGKERCLGWVEVTHLSSADSPLVRSHSGRQRSGTSVNILVILVYFSILTYVWIFFNTNEITPHILLCDLLFPLHYRS